MYNKYKSQDLPTPDICGAWVKKTKGGLYTHPMCKYFNVLNQGTELLNTIYPVFCHGTIPS